MGSFRHFASALASVEELTAPLAESILCKTLCCFRLLRMTRARGLSIDPYSRAVAPAPTSETSHLEVAPLSPGGQLPSLGTIKTKCEEAFAARAVQGR